LRLKIRKDHIRKRLANNEQWAAKFDKEIKPFEAMYTNMTKNMETLYTNAKRQHAEGIQVLKREFNYHPMYKKPGHNFSAVPFRPQ